MNCEYVYEKILVYERILYELDKINKIESVKFFAQTSVEINTIETELNKHKKKLYNYFLLFDTMIDNNKLLFNSKYNISDKCKDEK